MMTKMAHCPVGEEDSHAIENHIKGKIDHFVIPDGAEYDKQALKSANKAWRQYRFSLRKEPYKPKEKTLDDMCSQVPPLGICSFNWIKLDDECGENKSLLALWIKSHTGKDKSFLSGTVTDDLWYDDVNAEVELLRLKYPTKSQLELENEAFMENYRNIIMVVLKKKWLLYTKKNDKLEKEKEKLKDKVVIALRKRKSSLKLLNYTQELLGMTHQ
ncbi:Refilin-A, partial [Bienertia sinuspersici]